MLKTELLIIGGGAAGMAAALAATGQTVLLVERDSRLGGVLPTMPAPRLWSQLFSSGSDRS